jgi:hypothetical protein
LFPRRPGGGKNGRPGPSSVARNTKAGSLNKKITGRINRLNPAQQAIAKNALAKAQAGVPKATRPGKQKPVGKKKPVVGGKKPSGVRLPKNTTNLAKATLSKPPVRNGAAIANKLIQGKPLTPVDVGNLQLSKLKGPGLGALLAALAANAKFQGVNGFVGALGAGLGGVGDGSGEEDGAIPVGAEGDGDEPGPLQSPGGACSISAPPGFDPCAPAMVCPETPGQPNGPGEVCSVDPDSISGCNPDGVSEGPVEDGEEQTCPPPIDSVWQVVRGLKVCNASTKTIRVFLQYEALNSDGEWQEFGTDQPLEYALKPNEVAVLKDGDWDIAARRVRVWAEAEDGSQKWVRFKDKELNLVPEPEDGYASPQVQVVNLAFR